jgi:hypothetical protein
MRPGDEKTSEDLAKIRQDIVALRRRLKINRAKSKRLSSDTEFLLKKVEKRDPEPPRPMPQ